MVNNIATIKAFKKIGIMSIQNQLSEQEFQTLFVETVSQYRFLLGFEKPAQKDIFKWQIMASFMYNSTKEINKVQIIKFFNSNQMDFKIEEENSIRNTAELKTKQQEYEDEFIYYRLK